MKGFVAYYSRASDDAPVAKLGELVVPCFCVGSGPYSEFLGIETFRPSPGAMVVDVDEKDVESIVNGFVSNYPGLPAKMVEAHAVASFACAEKLKEGAILTTEVHPDKATVLDRGTHKQYVVWKNEDPAKY